MAKEPEVLTPEEQAELDKGAEVKEPPKELTPPEGEPTETQEEELARLREESELLRTETERLEKESHGRLNEIINLRGRARAPERESSPLPKNDMFSEREKEDFLTVADAQKMQESYQRDKDSIFLQAKLMVSEDLARERHKDYDEAALKFDEMAQTNPALMGVAYMEKNPGEYIYKTGAQHPDLIAKAELKAKMEGKKEVIDKITKPRTRLPQGGGGGRVGGPMTAEQAAGLSLEEFAALPPEQRAKFLKETGS